MVWTVEAIGLGGERTDKTDLRGCQIATSSKRLWNDYRNDYGIQDLQMDLQRNGRRSISGRDFPDTDTV
jgi:hypothetical protein